MLHVLNKKKTQQTQTFKTFFVSKFATLKKSDLHLMKA